MSRIRRSGLIAGILFITAGALPAWSQGRGAAGPCGGAPRGGDPARSLEDHEPPTLALQELADREAGLACADDRDFDVGRAVSRR